jgi:ABC-type sugar transport system substrate-binding protein
MALLPVYITRHAGYSDEEEDMRQARLVKLVLILSVLLSTPINRGKASPAQQGCPSAKGSYQIGFASLGPGSLYTETVSQGIEEAARKTGKVKLVVMTEEQDAAAALAKAKQMTAQPLDGLIAYSSDSRLDKSVVEHFRATKLPMISVDAAWPGATFVGADMRWVGPQAGADLAEWINQNWDGKLDAIMLLEPSVRTAIPSAQLRQMLIGLRNNLKTQVPDDRIVDLNIEDTPIAAYQAVIAAYQKQKLGAQSHVAILAIDDYRAQGAVAAVAALDGREPAILIAQHATEVDLTEIARKGSSYLGATNYFPEKYGEQVIDAMLDMLECKPVPATVYTDAAYITRSDLCRDHSDATGCGEPGPEGTSVPPGTPPSAIYAERPSYSGNCRLRPRGTVCVRFSDGYMWLLPDSIGGFQRIQEGNEAVEIASGTKALYYHVLKTNKIRVVIRSRSVNQ